MTSITCPSSSLTLYTDWLNCTVTTAQGETVISLAHVLLYYNNLSQVVTLASSECMHMFIKRKPSCYCQYLQSSFSIVTVTVGEGITSNMDSRDRVNLSSSSTLSSSVILRITQFLVSPGRNSTTVLPRLISVKT